MLNRQIAWSVVIGMSFGAAAQADLVAHEGFEGYAADASVVGLNGGSGGWTDAWISNASGGTLEVTEWNLDAGGRDGGSQALLVDSVPNAGYAFSRPFERKTGDVYVSFLFRADNISGNEFINFYLTDASVNDGPIGNGDANEMAGGGVTLTGDSPFFARYGSSASGVTDVTSISATDPVQDFLVVLKVSKTQNQFYNQIEMWLYDANNVAPAVEGTAAATATHAVGSNMNGISRLSLRTHGLEAGEQLLFDEINVGTSWVSVIPEPGSLALLAPAVATVLLRRRANGA